MRGATFAGAAMVAVLVGVGGGADGGTITQNVFFHLALHGTTFNQYNQLDPSLGPLVGVAFAVAYSGEDIFTLTNTSASTINTNVTSIIHIETDAGFLITPITTTTLALAPGASASVSPSNSGAPTSPTIAYSGSSELAGDPGRFVGTGQLNPTFFDQTRVTADNPAVRVSFPQDFVFVGTETVTYTFGAVPNPEPASVVMLSLGLAGVGAVAWRRGKVA